MAHRYVVVLLVIFLSGAMLAVQGVVGFSEASRNSTTHGNYSRVKVTRVPQKLVLRSASAVFSRFSAAFGDLAGNNSKETVGL